jgi:ParB family chromosome partitioning protein
LEAAKLAGLQTVPAISRPANDQDLLEIALIENIQRAELNPLEEADAYRQLSEDFGLSHEEIALRVGKSRPAISNTLRLLQLSEAVKKSLIEGYAHEEEADQDFAAQGVSRFRLSEGHARALLHLSAHQAQDAALKTVLAGKLNVRQTEELVKRWGGEKRAHVLKNPPTPEVAELEKRLEESLETKVKLRYSKGSGGTVTIRYYSDEELNKLLERLL